MFYRPSCLDDLASKLISPAGIVTVAFNDKADIDSVGDVLWFAVVECF